MINGCSDFLLQNNVVYEFFSVQVHFMGVGDFEMNDLSILADPCPLPSEHIKRSLKYVILIKYQLTCFQWFLYMLIWILLCHYTLSSQREKKVYAPMTDIGDMIFDADGIYIQIRDHQLNFTDPSHSLAASQVL